VLLQILEEGRLTDAQGRKVDFKNAIVIMTSNIGARDIAKNRTIGFTMSSGEGLAYDELKDRVTGELKKMFRPEFLNRVDEVIVFHDLTSEEIAQIVDLMIGRLRDQLMLQGIGITLSNEARSLLAAEGFDPALGARPLRRAIQRRVEDPLSEQILAGQWQAGDTIEVAIEDGEVVFRKGTGAVAVPVKSASEAVSERTRGTTPRSTRKSSRGGGHASGGAAGS